MKKIKLKRSTGKDTRKRIGYKISYDSELNPAQYEAVMHNNGAALVIAGAGTGKTRTLVYRVARLIEDGVAPESILLLTFTRKAASEMLRRASILLDGRCEKVSGGTFHSFALTQLRTYAKAIGYDPSFNVLDQSDSEDVLNLLRSQMKMDKSKKRFPRKNTLQTILSLSINKRTPVKGIVENSYSQFVEEIDNIEKILSEFEQYKRKYNLMDYDDLLLNFHFLLNENPRLRGEINNKFKYVMIDEYQDTNRLQHEIVLQLAGPHENGMVVGDDAQSIYSFRGADFQNIMFFPESFADCKVYKIEENYRSMQPILNLTNEIIRGALYKYEKELFTRRVGDLLPKVISAKEERQQSQFVVQQLLDLREEGIELNDIGVLFRSGFHSFDLEIELNRANIPYTKFGGIKFIETAHIKDMLAYLRVMFNPKDAVSWQRILLLLDGVGPRTASMVMDKLSSLNSINPNIDLPDSTRGKGSILELLKELKGLSEMKAGVGEKSSLLAAYYKPVIKNRYDDWQKRWKDMETFIRIAERYRSLRSFLNDMAIEPPVESVAELTPESEEDEYLTLSTIHSAKGLEWRVVFLIWALEGRFPSARAVEDVDSLEEERRLFYVACTRAKDDLYISYPTNIFDRATGFVLSDPSRFLKDIDEKFYEKYLLVGEEDEDEENDKNGTETDNINLN